MRSVAALCLLILTFQLPAQDITVTAGTEKDTIYIGDQIYYNIEVEQPLDLSLDYYFPADTLMESILVLGRRGPDSTIHREDNRVSISLGMLITSFDTGFYEIPPFYVLYAGEGKEIRYYSDFVSLTVVNTDIVPPDTTDIIFDIVAPYSHPLTAREIIPRVILLMAGSVLIWYIIKRLRDRKKPEGAEPVIKMPSEPLHIIALRELDRLDRKKLWQQGEIKLFYTSLAVILKQYLSGRYRISCLEMTTAETMEALRYEGLINEQVRKNLDEIFTTADFSKFARYRPGDNLNSVMTDKAREVVKLLAAEKSAPEMESAEKQEVKPAPSGRTNNAEERKEDGNGQ
ncbi:MAG: hypothetical protein LC649_00240 [Bacteroidales bacterium]|nr:hypothetical protein [Bacteroidales bacterium]